MRLGDWRPTTMATGITRSGNYPQSPGVALIINIMKFRDQPEKARDGSHLDENHFVRLFGAMGFKVIQERDCTRAEFERSLHAAMGHFLEGKYYAGPFFLCIMSHGNEEGILLHDGDRLSVEQIVSLFTEDHCKNIEDRAKVLLIQACRGNTYLALQPNGTAKTQTYRPDLVEAKDRQADILVFRSCVDKRLSLRSPVLGSRFVSVFCEVVASKLLKNEKCEILDVIRDVTNELNKRLILFRDEKVFATPEVTKSTLTKNLLLDVPAKNRTHLKGLVDDLRRMMPHQTLELADDGTSRGSCTCKTGCRPSSRCSCQSAGRPCGPGCHKAENAPCFNKTRRCACDSTCQTDKCGCYKAGGYCGADCHPRSSMCENGELRPATTAAGKAAAAPQSRAGERQGKELRGGLEGLQGRGGRQEGDAGQATEDSDATTSCGCKTGCGHRRCGCVKAGKGCNADCHPNASNCENKRERVQKSSASHSQAKAYSSQTLDRKDSRVTNETTSSEDNESEDSEATTSCGCKSGCGNRRCGCVKAGKGCNADCHPNASNCENERERVQKSSASHSQAKAYSSETLDRKDSRVTNETTSSEDSEATTSCGCKSGCGNRRCGCVKAGKGCNADCHPNASNCENKREKVLETGSSVHS